MPSTKKLLSITNLKKYFPVAKSSIFQRTKRYVRANEDISIDIYEGEYLGKDQATGKPLFRFIEDDDEREARPVVGYLSYFEYLLQFVDLFCSKLPFLFYIVLFY